MAQLESINMTEQLKHILNLVCSIYPMDELDKKAHEEVVALLGELILKEDLR